MNPVCSSARNQVTILGINSLFGKVVSFLLKQSPVANRLVLYDEADIRVAHDIAEIPTPCKIVVYNGEEQLRCAVKNSDVILIGDKDDCLTNDDEAISRKAADIVRYAQAISSIAPSAIVLIAATPVNSLLPLFTEAQIGCGTFDCDKVMGVTSADTMRASTLLARHMGIEPEKAYLPVIGGSSADTRIPLFSQSRPTINATKNDLKNLTRVVKMTENELKRMLNRGEALNKAYATVQLIDSVMSALRGQRNISEIVLSRTCLVPNVDYFSLPVILGPRGIAHRFPLPALTERESILLDHAVKHIEIDKKKGINALSGESCILKVPEVTEKYSELINSSPNDLVGSLMEKFKFGVDCPEVCAPRVEYQLLSKVKLKLPPESQPSVVPKRSKFIEPDTLPQDGCCPIKLPCPPIPPIRGLNQIQARHTCKIKDKPRACKCFFPPVEKSLVPCKLCPSNKPCASYGDFKSFYEEHGHCCGPITDAIENSSAEVALITIGGTTSNVATQEPSSVQLVSPGDPDPQVSLKSLDTSVLSIAPGELVMTSSDHPEKMSFDPVSRHQKPDVSQYNLNPTMNTEQQLHQNTNQVKSTEKTSEIPTSYVNQQSAPYPQQSQASSVPSTAQQSNTQTTNPINQPGNPSIQHEDPNWPFKCSTSLCLDILAPKTTENKPENCKPAVPDDHTREAQKYAKKHTEQPNKGQSNTEPNVQHPPMTSPVEQNKNPPNKNELHKRYNYSSGLSLTKPQDVTDRSVANENSNQSNNHESSLHSLICQSSPTDDQHVQLFPNPPSGPETSGGISAEIQYYSSNLKGSCKASTMSNMELPGFNQTEQQAAIADGKIINSRAPKENRKYGDVHTMDDNVKRRLYATLKVIEDVKSYPQSTASNMSLSQYFKVEQKNTSKSGITAESSENSMISILRERARAINANMELQRDLQACLERSRRRRRKENIGFGDLLDTINPVKRLPKRLEGRPALRKAYRGLQNIYEEPKHLSKLSKSASIPATPRLAREEKSSAVVEDSKESKQLASRVEKIKERIQQKLKKIIYPANLPSELNLVEKISKHQQRVQSNKLVTRPTMKKRSKQDFFIEMRRMDPAYRPTTSMYAPKCPTKFLYNNHPKNHSKMITFNNVIEGETTGNRHAMLNHPELSSIKQSTGNRHAMLNHPELSSFKQWKTEEAPLTPTFPKSLERKKKFDDTKFIFPNVPDFPELIFRDMESKTLRSEICRREPLCTQNVGTERSEEPERWSKDEIGEDEPYSVNSTQQSGFPRIRGDYVKHFDTQTLPNATLPESVKDLIRERRNVVTVNDMKSLRRNDMRYGMTSPNRLTYPKRHN